MLRRVERKEDDILRRRVTLVLDESAAPLAQILGQLSQHGIAVASAEYDKKIDERRVRVTFQARVAKSGGVDLLALLESQAGVRRVRIEPLG